MADVLATAARSAIIFSTAASFLVSPSVAALLAGGNSTIGMREDRANRRVIAIFAGGGASAYLNGDTVRWLGVILFAVGGALRIWPVYRLGNRSSGLVALERGSQPRHHQYLQLHSPPEPSRHSSAAGGAVRRGIRRLRRPHDGSLRASES